MAIELRKNKDVKFQCKVVDSLWIAKNVNGSIMFDDVEHPRFLDFSDCILRRDNWELVREPVDFMTAVNSGKRIKSCENGCFHSISWYLKVGMNLTEINGKWLIE